MARAAGNSGFYQISVIDQSGNARGRSIDLPSVTHILKVLPKFGLDWWGAKLGVKGALHELASNRIKLSGDIEADTENVYKAFKATKLYTPTAQMEQAGGKGTDVHDYAEALLRGKGLPAKTQIPSEQLPYVEAMYDFCTDKLKGMDIIGVEETVFSLRVPMEHTWPGYAGTLDAITYDPQTGIYYFIDWKTSKAIYSNHLLQLPPYRQAAIEQGLVPPDADTAMLVVRLGKNGKYEFKPSDYTNEQFLQVKQMWELVEGMKTA